MTYNPIIYLSQPQEIDIIDEIESTRTCYCKSCQLGLKRYDCTTWIFVLGLLIPILWIFNIGFILFGCFWVDHDERNEFHVSFRARMLSRAWYNANALIIYSIFATLIVYGIHILQAPSHI